MNPMMLCLYITVIKSLPDPFFLYITPMYMYVLLCVYVLPSVHLNCINIVASGAMLQESEGVWAHIQHSTIRDLDKALSGNSSAIVWR